MPVGFRLRIKATSGETDYWLIDGKEGERGTVWSEIEWK
jgi:hypothetical protein